MLIRESLRLRTCHPFQPEKGGMAVWSAGLNRFFQSQSNRDGFDNDVLQITCRILALGPFDAAKVRTNHHWHFSDNDGGQRPTSAAHPYGLLGRQLPCKLHGSLQSPEWYEPGDFGGPNVGGELSALQLGFKEVFPGFRQ